MTSKTSYGRLGGWMESIFPERQLYIRSGAETRGYVLSPGKQLVLMIFTSALVTWLAISTGFTLFFAASHGAGSENQLRMVKAQSERWIADRQARLDIATQQATANSGSLEDLAKTVESRHQGLVTLLKDFKGVPGAMAALAPAPIDDSLPPSNASIRSAPNRNAW